MKQQIGLNPKRFNAHYFLYDVVLGVVVNASKDSKSSFVLNICVDLNEK